jgi:hypothetical protein
MGRGRGGSRAEARARKAAKAAGAVVVPVAAVAAVAAAAVAAEVPVAATAAAIPGAGGITPQTFNAAFDSSPGAKLNVVRLDHFREKLGGTREQQDAAIRTMQLSGHYALDSHEGFTQGLPPSARAAAIHQGGSQLAYIARRE